MIEIIVRYTPRQGSSDPPYFISRLFTPEQLGAVDVDALIAHETLKMYHTIKHNTALEGELDDGAGMNDYHYRGWRISYNGSRPATGTWRAERFGVGMCNNSEESIKRMVDTKVDEERQWRNERGME